MAAPVVPGNGLLAVGNGGGGAADGSSAPPSPAPLQTQLKHWAAELEQIEAERAKMDSAAGPGSRRHSRNSSRRASGEQVDVATSSSNPSPVSSDGASFGQRAPPPTGMVRSNAGNTLASLRQADLSLALAGAAVSRARGLASDGESSAPPTSDRALHSGGGSGRPRSQSSGEPSPSSAGAGGSSNPFGRVFRDAQSDRLVLEGSDEDADASSRRRQLEDVRESPIRESESRSNQERLRERERQREQALLRERGQGGSRSSHQSPSKPERSFHLQHLQHSLPPTQLFSSAEETAGTGEIHASGLLPSLGEQQHRRRSAAPPPTAVAGGRSPIAGTGSATPIQALHHLLQPLGGEVPTVREGLTVPRSGANSRRQSGGGLGPTIAMPLNSLRPATLAPLPPGMNGERTPNSAGSLDSGAAPHSGGGQLIPLSAGGGLSALSSSVGRTTGPSSGSSTPLLRPSRRGQLNHTLAPLAASHSLQAQQLLEEGEGSVLLEPGFGASAAASASNSRAHSPLPGLRSLGAGSRRLSAEHGPLPRSVDNLPAHPTFQPNMAAAAAFAQAAQPQSLSSLAAARANRRRSGELGAISGLSDLGQQQLSGGTGGSLNRIHPLSSNSSVSGAPSATGSAHSSRPTTPFSTEASFQQAAKRRSLPPLGLADIGEKLNEHAADAL